MKNYTRMLWGLILIALGVIIGGNALNLFDIDIFFAGWWTLFIIIPSFIGIFNDKDKTANIIFFIIGILLLLSCQEIITFDLVWSLLAPIVLIIIGLSFVFKDAFSEKIKKLNAEHTKDDAYWATFSGQEVKADKEKFKGADMNAIFGSIKFDLKDTKITKDVTINATSIFGGVELILPDDVNIKVRSTSIFGGVDDKKQKANLDEDSKVIYVNATCIFGGVEIK